uniref:Uncharacterized protein n=1 Tax=Accipiter nisus TaxID=211598 RepID=A0A8B9MKH3_9AVES
VAWNFTEKIHWMIQLQFSNSWSNCARLAGVNMKRPVRFLYSCLTKMHKTTKNYCTLLVGIH